MGTTNRALIRSRRDIHGIEKDNTARAEAMPDSLSALKQAMKGEYSVARLWMARRHLLPKDGSQFAITMWGSIGIHSGHDTG